MHFTVDYREEIRLEQRASTGSPESTVVTLRLLVPSDKELLRAGFERMSPASRYRRFFTVKNHLTEAELRYLTEIDGYDHFALGALHKRADGVLEGIGVGRLVRLHGEVAEMAIAVIDEWQGCGLGTNLFHRLVAAARERGIRRIHSEVLASNQPLRRLVESLRLPVDTRVEDGIITADLTLPPLEPGHPASAPPRDHPGYRLLSLAAQGLVELRRSMPTWLGGSEDAAEGGTEDAAQAGTEEPAEDDES